MKASLLQSSLHQSIDLPCNLDIVRAMSEAIQRVSAGTHDPWKAHNRVREFYSWAQITVRTEKVYDFAMKAEQPDLWTRMKK